MARAPRARKQLHSDQTERAEDERALEVVGAVPGGPSSDVVELALKTITTPKASRHSVAVSSREYSIGTALAALLGRRGGRCCNAGRAHRSSSLHQRAEALAALGVVAERVEARARRGEQHDLAGPRGRRPPPRRPPRGRRSGAAPATLGRRRQRALDLPARSHRSGSRPRSARRRARPAARTPRPSSFRRGSRARRHRTPRSAFDSPPRRWSPSSRSRR